MRIKLKIFKDNNLAAQNRPARARLTTVLHGCLTLGALLPLLHLVSVRGELAAQSAYTTANGSSSIRPWRYGFLSADFNEAKFGLTFVRPLQFGCDEEQEDCLSNQLNFSLQATAAARKGQRDLLSKVSFLPGFDIGGSVAYVAPRESGGYTLVYLRGTYTGQERKIASAIDDSTVAIGEAAQRTYAGAIGLNYAISNVSVFGISFEGRRELSSPGAQRASEVCGPGRSEGGFIVIVCTDRYVGPLPDLWTGQARADAIWGLARLSEGVNGIHLSLITSASVDFTEDAARETNLALGGALSLPEYPGEPVVALMFGMENLSDANLTPLQLEDSFLGRHFLTRLAFSIPFKIMAGT